MEPALDTHGSRGFTLIEVLVALACTGIVIVGLFRLLTTAYWSYSMQDKLTDMHMNSQYAIKKLTEVLEQTGSYLPGYRKNVNVVTWSAANDVTLLVNPFGGAYIFSAAQTGVAKIVVDSASYYQGTNSLLYVSPDTSINPVKLKFTPIPPCTISLASPRNFAVGDALYSVVTQRISQNGTSICSGTDTLVDNIESVRMIFMDALRNSTPTWSAMKSCSLTVVSRTSVKMPHYPGDGYARDTVRMIFGLMSKQL